MSDFDGSEADHPSNDGYTSNDSNGSSTDDASQVNWVDIWYPSSDDSDGSYIPLSRQSSRSSRRSSSSASDEED